MIDRKSKDIKVIHIIIKNTSFSKQGWANFFLSARLFGRANLLARPIRHAKNGWSKPKCTPDGDKTSNIAFCSLLPK